MKNSLVTVFFTVFWKFILALFVVNSVLIWMLSEPYGVSASNVLARNLGALFALEMLGLGIFLHWSNAQQHLWNSLEQSGLRLNFRVFGLALAFAITVQWLPVMLNLLMVEIRVGNATLVEFIELTYLLLFSVLGYFAALLLVNLRHWSTLLVLLGCLPLILIVDAGRLEQFLSFIFLISLFVLYLWVKKSIQYLISCLISSLGFLMLLVALLSYTSLMEVQSSTDSDVIVHNFNRMGFADSIHSIDSYTGRGAQPLTTYYPAGDGDIKLDWIRHKIEIDSSTNSIDVQTYNYNQSYKLKEEMNKRRDRLFSDVESLWLEKYPREVPAVQRMSNGYVFAFPDAVYKSDIVDGKVELIWKKTEQDEAITWAAFTWNEEYAVQVFAFGSATQMTWFTVQSFVDLEPITIDIPKIPIMIHLDLDMRAQYMADFRVAFESGSSLDVYDLYTGDLDSSSDRSFEYYDGSEGREMYVISPLHYSMLMHSLGEDPREDVTTKANIGSFILAILAALILFRKTNNLPWKLLAVLLGSWPVLVALLVYYPPKVKQVKKTFEYRLS